MESNNVKSKSNSERKLDEKDIKKLAIRSALLQSAFNYERMQGIGWTHSMIPALEKIYKDDEEGLSNALKDNSGFINTTPTVSAFLMGLIISLEEKKEDRNLINSLKVALFGPLAGIGDALLWFTLLPIVAGICSSFAQQGSIIGPVIFFIVYIGVFLSRIYLALVGYNVGSKAIERLKNVSKYVTKAATILGITVIGGLIASYVNMEVLTQIPINADHVISIQNDFLDKIIPKLLPLSYTFLMYYLLKFKKINPVVLIVCTFVLAIVCSYFKIL